MDGNKIIDTVVEKGLCTGCGTCAGICPTEAIKMIRNNDGLYVPKVGANCNYCRSCVDVCPGYVLDFKKLNQAIFGKHPENRLVGNIVGAYIGYTKDQKLRYNSSSGGLVTSLLIFALEERIIDGALVTRMKEKSPLEPEAFIARTRKQLISATGSKYCPVPVNLALQEIQNSEGKFAVVGLPCHIHGIRKAEEKNKNLKGKILLHIGLFCSHSVSFKGTQYLLDRVGIKKNEVKEIKYRKRGWKGPITIKTNNGQTIFIPWNIYRHQLFDLFYFTPSRCLLCTDMTNELADISFGDAWLPEFSNENLGESFVITRNYTSENILRDALIKQKVELKKVCSTKILEQHSNRNTIRFKKTIKARFLPFKIFLKQTPSYNGPIFKPKTTDFLIAILSYFNAHISTRKYMLKFIPILKTFTNIAKKFISR